MTVAEHLVGRADELGVLDHLLPASMTQAAAMAVEVVGEPGIGKTRLLAELADRAEARRPSRALGIGVGAGTRRALWAVR